jgi:hypothetical protein
MYIMYIIYARHQPGADHDITRRNYRVANLVDNKGALEGFWIKAPLICEPRVTRAQKLQTAALHTYMRARMHPLNYQGSRSLVFC